MSNKSILFRTNASETCDYFCRLVLVESTASEELKRLLDSFRKTAWAVDAMANRPACVDIRAELVFECIAIASFLIDKMTNELSG